MERSLITEFYLDVLGSWATGISFQREKCVWRFTASPDEKRELKSFYMRWRWEVRARRKGSWEEKNERREREKNRWADTWGTGEGRTQKELTSSSLSQRQDQPGGQGHNHCQDDPASGAVMICGWGAHKSVFSNPPTHLLHFHAFPLLFKCLPQQSPSSLFPLLIPP